MAEIGDMYFHIKKHINENNLVWPIIINLVIAAVTIIYVLIYFLSNAPRKPDNSELEYIDNNNKTGALPKYTDKASTDISIVVPAYNETERIKPMLIELVDFFKSNQDNLKSIFKGKETVSYEILIVDDGSKDDTKQFVLDIANATSFENSLRETSGTLKVLQFTANRGKGGAVTQGLLHSSGEYILFADADGASEFSGILKLLKKIYGNKHGSLAIGSRAHMVDSDSVVKRSFIRNLLMYGLHSLVYVFGIRDIKDTQCGFKLFNRRSMNLIFPFMRTERWIFDVEILILALRKSCEIHEVPINWHEVDGSKVDLATDSIKMAIDLVVIRLAYMFGIYRDDIACN
ncbi:hypothetical protein QEN19_000331 [Hanseniaspora menglaensis]